MMPLDDVLVLDLSRVLSGPYCSMYLGDFGARVIKIERPPGGDDQGGDDTRAFGPPFVGGESTYYLSINRNKYSLAIDLKSKDGQDLCRRLAQRADVLLENFRPGVLSRLGMSYEALRVQNPRLIYCSISGFGADSPKPGYDVVAQGMGGFASLTGEEDGPPLKAGLSIADLVSGLNATIGILTALHARHRTGRGQHVDISMLDGQVALLTYHATMYLNTGTMPKRMGNRHPSIAPYETYATADGHINVAAANENLFVALWKLLGLEPDARFCSNSKRVENRTALNQILEPIFVQRPSAAWLAELESAGIPCGPILTVPQVLSHPNVLSRKMVTFVPHEKLEERGGPKAVGLTGVPIKLSDTPGSIRRPPPLLGQDTSMLAQLLGLPPSVMADLVRRGVIH